MTWLGKWNELWRWFRLQWPATHWVQLPNAREDGAGIAGLSVWSRHSGVFKPQWTRQARQEETGSVVYLRPEMYVVTETQPFYVVNYYFLTIGISNPDLLLFLSWYFIPRVLSKCKNASPEWLRWGLRNCEHVGKAHCIETLNRHRNTLVQERS